MKKQEMTYESAHAELQEIVRALQNEAVGIDDLAEKIARAQVLIRFCQEKLRTTEKDLASLGALSVKG